MKRLLVPAIAGLLAAACAPGSSGSSGGVRFQVAGEAEEIAIYRTLVGAFEREERGEVDLVEVADKDDHLQKLTTAFAAGDAPDVFLVNFREYSQFVVRGALEPVGPHLAEHGIEPRDYYSQPLEAFTYDGTLQCMPQNISSLVVYYNARLLRDAGLDRPPPEWSWQEFRRYAQRLTTEEVRGLGIDPQIICLAPFIWSAGGDLVDDLERPTRFTLDSAAAREALGFIRSLVREGLVPTEEEVAAQDLETRFVTEKVAMYLSSRRATPVLREQIALDWDVAPLPVNRAPAGILHSDAYCIARGGDVDAAMDFIGFATTSQGQTLTSLAGRTVPSLRAIAESPAFLNPIEPPEHAEVFLEGIPVLRRTPVIPTWPEIEDLASEELRRLFYEEDYTVNDAIERIDQMTRPLFAEAGR